MHPWPADSSSNLGEVDGEATHQLTKAELPNVSIGLGAVAIQNNATSIRVTDAGSQWYCMGTTSVEMTKPLGSGEPHNNMPPYIQVTGHVRAG